jgi:hypothetical protein
VYVCERRSALGPVCFEPFCVAASPTSIFGPLIKSGGFFRVRLRGDVIYYAQTNAFGAKVLASALSQKQVSLQRI